MAKEKKQKTPSQLKRQYRAIQYTTFCSEFLAVATPFVTIAIVNYDKYFVQYDGTKMSISFFMALALMGLAIWCITKKKLENSYITLLIGWATMAFICTMLGEMITDLATIMWFGLIGLGGAFGLDEVSKAYKKKKENITEAQHQANQEEMVEQVKVEKQEKAEKKAVKVRIKKNK